MIGYGISEDFEIGNGFSDDDIKKLIAAPDVEIEDSYDFDGCMQYLILLPHGHAIVLNEGKFSEYHVYYEPVEYYDDETGELEEIFNSDKLIDYFEKEKDEYLNTY